MLIPTWAKALAVVAATGLALGGAYYKGVQSTKTAWELSDAKAREQEVSQQLDLLLTHQEDVNRLNAALRKARDVKDATNSAALRRVLAVADGLRERPDRPIPGSAAASAAKDNCQGATGAELYRKDGEFLIWEAARADRARAALGECYSALDAAEAAASASKSRSLGQATVP